MINNRNVLVAPSVLSADFARLGEEIVDVDKAGADWIHFDIMDGLFVPNITMGPVVVKAVRPRSNLVFDVHLMITNPINFVPAFAAAGADLITFHVEACANVVETIRAIRGAGKKVGISLRPKTTLGAIKAFLDDVDMVLVMTVEPGFGGQAFMREVMPKLGELRKIFHKEIQVDGGINSTTAAEAIQAGADILVAGTAVFGEKDYRGAIRRLKGE